MFKCTQTTNLPFRRLRRSLGRLILQITAYCIQLPNARAPSRKLARRRRSQSARSIRAITPMLQAFPVLPSSQPQAPFFSPQTLLPSRLGKLRRAKTGFTHEAVDGPLVLSFRISTSNCPRARSSEDQFEFLVPSSAMLARLARAARALEREEECY